MIAKRCNWCKEIPLSSIEFNDLKIVDEAGDVLYDLSGLDGSLNFCTVDCLVGFVKANCILHLKKIT